MKKFLMWVISLTVTVGLLVLIFRKVEPGEVLGGLENSRPLPLLAALAVSFLTNCLLPAVKWRLILGPLGLAISGGETFLVKMGSAPLKSLLPFRSGEASRVIYLKRRHGFSSARATGSILFELLLNILIFLLFIVAGGLVCSSAPPRIVPGTALVLAGAMAAFLLAGLGPPRRWARRRLSRISNLRLQGGLETILTLHRFFSRGRIATLLFYSLVIQGGKLLTFFLIAEAFRLTFPPAIYLIILPFSILISTIPVTFLGIGVREGSLIELIPLYSSVAPSAILGPALIFSLIEYLFPALLGLLWTAKFTRRLLEKPAAAESWQPSGD